MEEKNRQTQLELDISIERLKGAKQNILELMDKYRDQGEPSWKM